MNRPSFLRPPVPPKAGDGQVFHQIGGLLRSPLMASAIVGGVLFLGGGLVIAGGTLGRSISAWLDAQVEAQARTEYETQVAVSTAEAIGQAYARLYETQASVISQAYEVEREVARAQIQDTRESQWVSRFGANVGDVLCLLERTGGNSGSGVCEGVTDLRRDMAAQYGEALGAGRTNIPETWAQRFPAPTELMSPEYLAIARRYREREEDRK